MSDNYPDRGFQKQRKVIRDKVYDLVKGGLLIQYYLHDVTHAYQIMKYL